MRGVSHSGCYPSKPRAGVGGRRDRRDLGPPVPSLAETPLCALFFSPSGEINYPRETLKASLSPVHAGAGLPDRVPTPSLFGFARSAAGGLKFPGLTPGALGHLTPQTKTFLPVLGQNKQSKRVQLLAVDHSARASMKNVISCDKLRVGANNP